MLCIIVIWTATVIKQLPTVFVAQTNPPINNQTKRSIIVTVDAICKIIINGYIQMLVSQLFYTGNFLNLEYRKSNSCSSCLRDYIGQLCKITE